MNQVREQTTADPSHTNSPSPKTPNNDEAVRHDLAGTAELELSDRSVRFSRAAVV